MKRIHAFEFEDLSWFPKNLRNYATDFLQFGANLFDVYQPVVPVIRAGIAKADNATIIDIASGGGGGLIKIAHHLKKEIPELRILLSDYYPNLDAFRRTKEKQPDTFDFIEAPIDAMNVPSGLKGLRTQFLSLHHFRPEHARAILQDAVNKDQPIAIFEAQQRNIKSLLPMLFSPVSVLLMTPFIRPFRIDRILFTYLIPVLPLFILWDGVISVLRTYTKDELMEMIQGLQNKERFDWQVEVVKGNPGEIFYLMGFPK